MKSKILIPTILFVAVFGILNGQDKYAILITGDFLAGGIVEINIFNNMGQLVDQEFIGLKNSGTHYFNFQNYSLSEGMYFYTLKVNGIRTDTKKMVIKN